jgi:hypothetical protein
MLSTQNGIHSESLKVLKRWGKDLEGWIVLAEVSSQKHGIRHG